MYLSFWHLNPNATLPNHRRFLNPKVTIVVLTPCCYGILAQVKKGRSKKRATSGSSKHCCIRISTSCYLPKFIRWQFCDDVCRHESPSQKEPVPRRRAQLPAAVPDGPKDDEAVLKLKEETKQWKDYAYNPPLGQHGFQEDNC